MVYIVQPGDTLYLIARRFGLTLNELLAANPQIVNPNLIYVGQRITIPEVTPPPAFRFYIIQPGDTLFRIAQRFGTTVQAILELNPAIVNPNLIYPGQRIRVPISPAAVPGCLVYVSTRTGNPEIWRSDPEGRNPVQLTRNAGSPTNPLASPKWSPDGQYIAYLAGDNLYLIDSCGRQAPFLLAEGVADLAWANDSRRIAYSTEVGTYIVNLQGESELVRENFFNPSWFPNNERLAGYTLVEDLNYTVMATVDVTGANFQVYDSPPVPAFTVKISPNGRYAATQLRRGSAFGEFSLVWVYDFVNNTLTELPGFEFEFPPGFTRNLSFLGGWSPDSNRLVYSTLLDTETGLSEIRIATPTGNIIQRFTRAADPETHWSPFANWIIYTVAEGVVAEQIELRRDIYIRNLQTNLETRVTFQGDNYDPDWYQGSCPLCG